ncbi:MAG TPA: chloride channel protein [Terriglobia bacterium]|nr:chloride channel protein [Terriglobia bacterium]
MTERAVIPETSDSSGHNLAPETGQGPKAGTRRGPLKVIDRLRLVRLTEGQIFIFFSVLVGLASGLLVVCFQVAIGWTRLWLLGSALAPSHTRVILVPTLAGLVVAFLVLRVFPRVRGSGVNQTKAAVYISSGHIPFSTVVGKFICCALAIGSGQSLGPEDPSLQIGAGFASALGRRLRLSREKFRLIAPVGAAAGLAAAFNAPISSVLFVIEEVIGKWTAGVLGAIVLSALSSVVVMRNFLGAEPLFRVTSYRLGHPSELLAYAVLGLVGGGAAVAFTRLIATLRPRLMRLPRRTHYLQPALAGLLIGCIGIFFPQVMGAGYETIDQAMHDQYVWQMMALLAVFKIVATVLSFSSGAPGGMFAPSLFIGAMLGGAVGGVERHFFPGLTGSVGAYALVGMGTFFAGFLRVPMTSVFMVLELSGNYSIIVPVMISNTIAYIISRKYEKVALFDMLARQEGMDLPSMEEQREEMVLQVESAMCPRPTPVLRGEHSVAEALGLVKDSAEQYFLVDQGARGWSGVTKELLNWQVQQGKGDVLLTNLPDRQRLSLPHLHPDQPLDVALRRIGDHPLLPVVSRTNLQHLEGVVCLQDVLRAYRDAFATSDTPVKAP